MLEPVGPLPPSVYWRRRAVATIAVVLVLAGLVWALSAALSADGGVEAAPDPATNTAPPSPVASRSALAVPPGGDPALPGTPGWGPVGMGTPAPMRPGDGPTGPLLGAGATGAAGDTPAPSPRAAAPAPTPAAGPCADSALKVAARTDKPRYGSGERPLFSLVVTNTGKAPCTRDVGPARTAMAVVVKAGDGLWGSDDCAPGGDPDVRTLAPGQEQVISLRWAGRTSLPGCPSGRATVPSGDYQLLTRLDDTVSAPAPFSLD